MKMKDFFSYIRYGKLQILFALFFFSIPPLLFWVYGCNLALIIVNFFQKATTPDNVTFLIDKTGFFYLVIEFFTIFTIMQFGHLIGNFFLSKGLVEITSNVKLLLFKKVKTFKIEYFTNDFEANITRQITSFVESLCKILELFVSIVLPQLFTVLINSFFTIKDHGILAILIYVIWYGILYIFCCIIYKIFIKLVSDQAVIQSAQAGIISEVFKNIFLEKTLSISAANDQKILNYQEKENSFYKKNIIFMGISKFIFGTINVGVFIVFYALILFKKTDLFNIVKKFNNINNIDIVAKKIEPLFLGTKIKNVMMSNWITVGSLWELFNATFTIIYQFGIFNMASEILNNLSDNREIITAQNIYKLEVKNIFYKPENNIILNKFNYTFKKDFIYLFKWNTGTGKSTLFNIITGLNMQTDGEIIINDDQVLDNTKKLSLNSFNYINQNGHIFNDTLEFNIKIANMKLSDEKFNQICNLCGINAFAKNFKDHYKYQCGLNGCNLSGGQKKLVEIARFLASETSSVLIFDEVLTGLSKEYIDLIKVIINTIRRDKIILIAEHNNHLLDLPNVIIVNN